MIYQKVLVSEQDSPSADSTVLYADEISGGDGKCLGVLIWVHGPFGRRPLVLWYSSTQALEWLFKEPITPERFLDPSELEEARGDKPKSVVDP